MPKSDDDPSKPKQRKKSAMDSTSGGAGAQFPSQPQPPVNPLRRPFVGNETIDDNLTEAVKVAIWNVMGERGRALSISVRGGVAALTGPVSGLGEADAVRMAALSIAGISDVVDQLQPGEPGARPAQADNVADQDAALATRIIYLIRFCGLDDASTGAAIRQAIGRLDHLFAERKLPLSERLVLIYRNLIPGALTLEIGYPIPPHGIVRAEGEFHIAELPPVAEQAACTAPGLFPLIANLRDLMRAGHSFAWQELASSEFRPWQGHPALPLNVAAGL